MSPRPGITWPTPVPVVVPPGPGDRAVTYKGVQIAAPASMPYVVGDGPPTVDQLLDANVGCVRPIAHFNYSPAALQDYLQPIADAGIYILMCVGQGQATTGVLDPTDVGGKAVWEARIRALADVVHAAGHWELMNEPGSTFKYDGFNSAPYTGARGTDNGSGTGWQRFFMCCEDAAAILRNPPYNKKVVLGAAENLDTNAFLRAANARYGSTYTGSSPSWSEFYDGVSIHAYSSVAGNIVTKLGTGATGARTAGRIGTPSLLANLPMWLTECGVGAGGNSGSGLASTPGGVNYQIAARAPAQAIDGTDFTLLTTTATPIPSGFPASGQLFFRNNDNPDQIRKINYGGKTANSFTLCNTWDCSPGEQIAGGEVIQHEVPDGNSARDTTQANYVTNMYNAVAPRAAKNDLHIKNIGWFIWRDYAGHKAPSIGQSGYPPNPINWAEFCGLCRWGGVTGPGTQVAFAADEIDKPVDTAVLPDERRPAYTSFKNVNGGARDWGPL